MWIGEEIENVVQLIDKGEYDLALQNIAQMDNLEIFEILILKSMIYRELGYKRQATEFAEKAVIIAEGQKSQFRGTVALVNRILATIIGGPFDHLPKILSEAKESFQKIRKVDEELRSYLEALLLTASGAVWLYIGNSDEAINDLSEAAEIWNELGNSAEFARTYYYMGIIHTPEIAIPIIQNIVKIWRSYGNRAMFARTLSFLGSKYILLGDYNNAITYNQEALQITLEINNKQGIAIASEYLGRISLGRGESREAIVYYANAVDIWKDLENPWFEAISLLALGRAYYHRGELDLSLKKLIECFHIREELGLKGEWLIEPLFHILRSCVDLGLESDVIMYNARLQELQKQYSTPNTTAFAYLIEGIILQSSPRLRYKMESQKYLELVDIDDPNVTWIAKILTMKYQCQALLIEVAHDNNSALFEEIEILINKILNIATKQYLNSMEIEARLFKSKVELIYGNISEAQLLLSGAAKIASEYGLGQMIRLVEQERILLTKDFEKWQELNSQSTTMEELIKHAQIAEYLELALDLKDRYNEF
ncbi:MAG: hypothetical protein ACW99A_13855 [Candidatus Kariarchaeaceae archaeon]|jgi:tetratricopeptide (TPR) repeat protein